MAVDFIKKLRSKARVNTGIQIDKELMDGVWQDRESWTLTRAPIKLRDDSYDDGRGTVELYGYEFDETQDLRETRTTLIITTSMDDHKDYTWCIPPSTIELCWEDEPTEEDASQIYEYDNQIKILSDMELKSFSVNIISRSQVIIDAVYQYHNEIM